MTTTETFEIVVDGRWAQRPPIDSKDEARAAIVHLMGKVETCDFEDIVNNNDVNRKQGVKNRRISLLSLCDFAHEKGTIHPAPGLAELEERSAEFNEGKQLHRGTISKHLAAEAELKRFIRIVRRGEAGNPRAGKRPATVFKLHVDKVQSQHESQHQSQHQSQNESQYNTPSTNGDKHLQPKEKELDEQERSGATAHFGVRAVASRETAAMASPVDSPSKPFSPSKEHAPQGGANDPAPPPRCVVCGEPGELRDGHAGPYYRCRSWRDERHQGKRPRDLFPDAWRP